MMTGEIARLFSDKKFGFITSPDHENDLFFHASAVVGSDFDDLRTGQRVTFDEDTAAASLRGPRCSRVVVP